jgi:hypothetical protein
MSYNVKINPLNVLGCREVQDPPPYFHYHYIDLKYNIVGSVKDWIYENLKHRFYFGECLVLENNQYSTKIKIGFEEPKEASFFLLACSHLKYQNN